MIMIVITNNYKRQMYENWKSNNEMCFEFPDFKFQKHACKHCTLLKFYTCK